MAQDTIEKNKISLKKRNPVKIRSLRDEEKNTYYASLPPYLLQLQQAVDVPVNSKIDLKTKPEWLDMELYRRGQEFHKRNFLGCNLSEIIGLFMIYSISNMLAPLIYTGKSTTIVKGYKRYISTNIRINQWFLDELWVPGSKANRSMKFVRDSHERVRQKMKNEKKEDLEKLITLPGQGMTKLRTHLYDETIADLQQSCPMSGHIVGPIYEQEEYFNQVNMVIVMFGFLAVPLLFPKHFGIHHETEKEFEGFIHVWRMIGYYLGIEDQLNFVNGSIEEARQKVRDIINYWMKPNLCTADHYWSHMVRVVTDASSLQSSVTHSIFILILFDCLEINSTNVWKKISFKEKFIYYFVTFIFKWIFWIKPLSNLLNRYLDRHSETKLNNIIKSPKEMKIFDELARKLDETPII